MPCVVESFPLRGGRRQTGVAMPAAAGRARMRSAAAAHQSSQQPDLPGVVNIVRCDPIELRQELFAARGFQHLGDRRAQRLVLALEQFLVRLPRCFTQIPVLWPGKEFTAWVRNRAALTLFNPPPYCVLPVCRVQGFFPDIVSPGSGTPSRLLRGQAAYRLFEIRSMPRALFVGFIEQRKDQVRPFNRTPVSEKHPKVRRPGGWRVVTWVSTDRACVRGGPGSSGPPCRWSARFSSVGRAVGLQPREALVSSARRPGTHWSRCLPSTLALPVHSARRSPPVRRSAGPFRSPHRAIKPRTHPHRSAPPGLSNGTVV